MNVALNSGCVRASDKNDHELISGISYIGEILLV